MSTVANDTVGVGGYGADDSRAPVLTPDTFFLLFCHRFVGVAVNDFLEGVTHH